MARNNGEKVERGNATSDEVADYLRNAAEVVSNSNQRGYVVDDTAERLARLALRADHKELGIRKERR